MTAIKKQLQKIPKSPGVYFFKNAKREIVYIGKAVNLNARVKSYFTQRLYGLKAAMIPEIAKIDHKITETEIDALILESQYIKKHRPKYNVMLKDDKNYFYVVITGDQFPKIFITHQPSKFRSSLSFPHHLMSFPRKRESRFDLGLDPRLRGDDRRRCGDNRGKVGDDKWDCSNLFYMGPYTDGTALKTTLRFLRKIFPYCTCKTKHKLPCLKAHLGLCLGFCCVKDSKMTMSKFKKHYFANIKSIIDILAGKKRSILAKLGKEMNAAAKKENFEKAAEIRNKISALKNIFEHKIDEVEPRQNCRGSTSSILGMAEISRIFGVQVKRIEFYDISNIQGQLATGSMVVFDNGKIDKSQYRKFKIKTVHQSDDPAMIKEALERRLKHTEWPMPDLIVVDGGIAQLNTAREVILNGSASWRSNEEPQRSFASLRMTKGSKIPLRMTKVASLAKNPDRLFLSPLKAIALKDLPENTRLLLQNLRDEAHRFAIGYHRKLRSKKLQREFK